MSGDTTLPNVAVIGVGYWGRNLARNFAQLGRLRAVVDANTSSAELIASERHAEATSLSAVLGDDRIRAVAVAVPAADHYRVTKAALEAGKHVFVEKPLALDLVQAEELCVLASEMRCTLMVGHLLQYHPAFLLLKDLVAGGTLGRLEYIYSNRLNLGRFRQEENILWSFAPHDISMILSLVGAEPSEVSAIGSYYLRPAIADVTTTHLSFPSGQRAHVFVSWLHPFKEQRLVAVGSEGMAVFDDAEPWERKLLIYRHRIEWRDGQPQPNRGDPLAQPLIATEPLASECLHFLESVRDGTRPRTDGEEGLRVLRVLDAAQRSLHRARRDLQRPDSDLTRLPGVEVHASSYVDDGVDIGPGTRIWHFSHILEGSRIGANCSIGQNVMIGPRVTIGDRCKIQNNVSLYEGVALEDGVFCGPSCVFTNVINPRAEIPRRAEFRPTVVRRGASIGANATIVCGHEIGEYSFIAAGAVVTADVPAHALMVGVPARRKGWMSHAGAVLGDDLICPLSGRRYAEISPNQLKEVVSQR